MVQDEERISIAFVKPKFRIGQTIYVPQKNKATKTRILGYDARVFKKEGNLLGIISGYEISDYVFLRNTDSSYCTRVVYGKDFYDGLRKARKASKFLEVRLDDEAWRIAVGDRDIQDKNSPYNLDNCNLHPCCANISEARDILLYCRYEGGLIIGVRDELTNLLFSNGHNFQYCAQSPIGQIFEQLQVK